jgi:hypothetical protein
MALDKARKQRVRGRPVFFVQSVPTTNVNPAPISYHSTRVVQVDPELLRANRIVASEDGDPTGNIYRILRSQVMKKMSDAGWSTLAMCSANQGEGKTLTAINLAISLALDVNQTVLLVDLDLRDPDVATKFGIAPEFGLDDFLRGRVDLAQCLINPGIERLVLLRAQEPLPGPHRHLRHAAGDADGRLPGFHAQRGCGAVRRGGGRVAKVGRGAIPGSAQGLSRNWNGFEQIS